MTDRPRARWADWAQLVRLPNVFTVLADTTAGFLLLAHAVQPLGRYAAMLAGAVALYWAGLVMNDVWDLDRDREYRPQRPLAAGRIRLGTARRFGWGLIAAGIVLSTASGLLPAEDVPRTWVPGGIAVALAASVLLYDGPLKRTALAPVAMGLCRVLSLMLGASPLAAAYPDPVLPPFVMAAAVAMGVYVMGVTLSGRKEEIGGGSNVGIGLGVSVVGLIMLAFAPRLATADVAGDFSLDVERGFPILIGLLAVPVLYRGLAAVSRPTPERVQAMVRHGVLQIIPLSAALAFLGAGSMYGLAVFALVFPALALAFTFRVT